MDQEQWAEFDSLREAVTDRLRSGYWVQDAGRRIVQYLVLPAFENPFAWEIRAPRRNREQQHRLFRVEWRFDKDVRAFESPVERLNYPRPFQPTVEFGSVPLEDDAVSSIVDGLRSAKISLDPGDHSCGADGVEYELAIGEFFCHTRIAWWVDLPDAWQTLRHPIERLVQLCESTWTATHPIMPSIGPTPAT